jgi:hypothetical protein
LQLAIYFWLHRGKFAGKHGKLASPDQRPKKVVFPPQVSISAAAESVGESKRTSGQMWRGMGRLCAIRFGSGEKSM